MKILLDGKSLEKKGNKRNEIVIAVYITRGVLRARDDGMVTYPF